MVWLIKAADNKGDDTRALMTIGSVYYRGGHHVEKDYDQALAWFMKGVELGDSDSEHTMGYLYSKRNDDGQDHNKALAWYRRAAEKDNAEAQDVIGWYYYKGLGGLNIDYKEAVEWWKKSAENGSKEAYAKMGKLHHYGYGVPIDYNEALRLYEQATKNNGTALNGIGLLYQNGLGVAQSHSKALEYFRLSADKEHREAYNSLGDVYYYGYGIVNQSYDEAFEWYTKAAERQYDKGQFNLGLMYMKGEGAQVNLDLALHWMKKAAYNGSDEAHVYIEKISQMIQDLQSPTQGIQQ